MVMSLHCQQVPGWVRAFLDKSGVGWIKIVDPPEQAPFPGVKCVARFFMPDPQSNDLVWGGATGAEVWWQFIKPQLDRRPWVWCVEAPNEPQPMSNIAFARQLDRFTVRLAELATAARVRLVGHNWGVGWPFLAAFEDPHPRAATFKDSVTALADGGHYLGLHEYSAPAMWDGGDGYCLRYRRTVQELRAAGARIPPILVTECGIDGGVIGQPKTGWLKHCGDPARYVEQLAWYRNELAKDGAVGFIFTAGPYGDWLNFEVTEDVAMRLAAVPMAQPQPEPQPAVPAVGKPPMVDLVDSLPNNPNATPYPERGLSAIKKLVIHHSATPAITTPEAIHRYHTQSLHWSRIAYHAVIAADGTIYRTNLLRTVSNHAYKQNTHTAGICLVGNFQEAPPTPAQLNAAADLVAWWGFVCDLRPDDVVGHKDLPGQSTACPGKTWATWRGTVTSRMKR